MNDIDRIAESFQDFIFEYRSSQDSLGISNEIKELMKRMSISIEEFQESCQMYHIKVNQSFNITNCAQNQMNESILAHNMQMQSQMSRTLIQPENHNRMAPTQIESPKKQSTTISEKKDTNSKSKISKLNQTELKSHSRRKRHFVPEITYMEDLRHKGNHQHHSNHFTRERK